MIRELTCVDTPYGCLDLEVCIDVQDETLYVDCVYEVTIWTGINEKKTFEFKKLSERNQKRIFLAAVKELDGFPATIKSNIYAEIAQIYKEMAYERNYR